MRLLRQERQIRLLLLLLLWQLLLLEIVDSSSSSRSIQVPVVLFASSLVASSQLLQLLGAARGGDGGFELGRPGGSDGGAQQAQTGELKRLFGAAALDGAQTAGAGERIGRVELEERGQHVLGELRPSDGEIGGDGVELGGEQAGLLLRAQLRHQKAGAGFGGESEGVAAQQRVRVGQLGGVKDGTARGGMRGGQIGEHESVDEPRALGGDGRAAGTRHQQQRRLLQLPQQRAQRVRLGIQQTHLATATSNTHTLHSINPSHTPQTHT